MSSDLLDWVARHRKSLVRSSWSASVVAMLALGLAAAIEGEMHPAAALGALVYFLPLYFGQYWLFVRRSRRDRGGERRATALNMLLPAVVFAVQGSLSIMFVAVAVLSLNASPELVFQEQGEARLVYLVVPVGLAVAALLSAWSLEREQALRRLAAAQLVLSWTSVVLLLSSFLGASQAAPYYLRQFGARADQLFVVFAMLLLHIGFALAVFASVQRSRPPMDFDSPRPDSAGEALPTGGYVSSARVLSFVLIVFTLLAFDVARSTSARVRLLREARDMFARQTARDVLATLPDARIADMPTKGEWTPVGEAIDFPTYGEAVVSTIVSAKPMEPGVTGASALYSVHGGFEVLFNVDDGRIWRSMYQEERDEVPGDEDPRERVEFPDALPQDFARILRRVGLPVDVSRQSADGYEIELQTFAAVEESLLRQPVSIPSLGLGVESTEAIWVLSVSVLVLLVLLRSRVDVCIERSNAAIDQPWLILDARPGIENLAAGGWLLAIGASAWVANGSLVALLVSEKFAQGALAAPPERLVATTAIFALVALGGWLSLGCVSQLMRLRSMRRAALRAASH